MIHYCVETLYTTVKLRCVIIQGEEDFSLKTKSGEKKLIIGFVVSFQMNFLGKSPLKKDLWPFSVKKLEFYSFLAKRHNTQPLITVLENVSLKK